jgi:stress response protein YsnF
LLPEANTVSMQNELNTITSSMNELSARITHLVETEGARMDGDVYTELVAAERTVGALLRRLNRVASRVK